MIPTRRFRIILTAGFALIATQPALADDSYTRLDVTDSTIGFSSPGNAYGPWIYQDARAVWVQPGQGAVNFEVAHEANGDQLFPTHGDWFAAGVTRDFTQRFYGNLTLGYGTAYPYAKNDVHVDLNYKTTPDLRLVLTGSEDFVTYYGRQTMEMLQLGPTYYYGTGDVQVRYISSANSNAQTKSGALFAWDITPSIRSKYTLTGLWGPQQYIVTTPGIPNALANYNGETYTVGTEQQLGRVGPQGLRWGVKVSGLLTHLTLAANGGPVYTGRGATLGVWSQF
jgi:YaiO family outer membrane protein